MNTEPSQIQLLIIFLMSFPSMNWKCTWSRGPAMSPSCWKSHFPVGEFMGPQGCWKKELPVIRQCHKGDRCFHEWALGKPRSSSVVRGATRAWEEQPLYLWYDSFKKKKKKERPAPLGLRGQETGPGKHVGLALQSAQHLWETIGPPFLVLENYLGLSMTFYFQNWATDLDLTRYLFLSPSPTSDPRHTLL